MLTFVGIPLIEQEKKKCHIDHEHTKAARRTKKTKRNQGEGEIKIWGKKKRHSQTDIRSFGYFNKCF